MQNVFTTVYQYTSDGNEYFKAKLLDVTLEFDCAADTPEDSTMGRGFSDVHRIAELVKKAYLLGQLSPDVPLGVQATEECV